MVAATKVNSIITKFVEKAFTPGKTVEPIKEVGSITRWMVSEFSPGLTANFIEDNIRTIINTAMEFSSGQMERDTKECGEKEFSTVEESPFSLMLRR